VIEVIDGGSGVAPEAVDRVFERFARADDARGRDAGGAGLGLAIVNAIVQAHDGRCMLTHRPRGTAFTLTLPGFRAAQAAARLAAKT